MNQRGLVGAELDLTGLHFLHCLAYVEGHRAGLRVRHESLWAEDFTQASDRLHHVGSGDQRVEVGPVFLGNLLHHLFAAGEVGASRFGFLDLVASCDDQNFLRLAQSVRQNHRAAHHLVGMLGIDSQPHGDFDGLVEFGVLHFLQKWNCVLQNIGALLDCGVRLCDVLSFFFIAHRLFSLSPTVRSAANDRGAFDLQHSVIA